MQRYRIGSRLIRLFLAGLATGCAMSATAGEPSDFYICANINRNYVIGSTIVTTNGLFQLDSATGEWSHLGYNDTTISAAAFDPRDHDVIYTSTLNGIWRSLDGGETWRMTNSWDMTEGRDVAVDPNAPDTVYLALPDGVAVSTNRGLTWERREKGLPDRENRGQARMAPGSKGGADLSKFLKRTGYGDAVRAMRKPMSPLPIPGL